MYCSKCGKQIADHSKFCSHCGAQIYAEPADTHKVAREAYVSQPAATPKKKGGFLKWVVTVIIASLVFSGVKFITEQLLSQNNDDSGTSIHIFDNDSDFEAGFKENPATDSDISNAMDSCYRGAVYQDGYVQYGITQLYLPGYSLLAGEGDDRDWLLSSDNAFLFGSYKQLEIPSVSFDQSDEEGLLSSYRKDYSDASMIVFQKYYVNDFPVIRYIIAYTADDVCQYHGELIVFPDETTDETIRLAIFADMAGGRGTETIEQIFDSLQVSPEYKVSADDADMVGLNRITVK